MPYRPQPLLRNSSFTFPPVAGVRHDLTAARNTHTHTHTHTRMHSISCLHVIPVGASDLRVRVERPQMGMGWKLVFLCRDVSRLWGKGEPGRGGMGRLRCLVGEAVIERILDEWDGLVVRMIWKGIMRRTLFSEGSGC